MNPSTAARDLARARDAADPLRPLRERFHLPAAPDGRALTYLCGHSLGLARRRAAQLVDEELQDWARLGVVGHHAARRRTMPRPDSPASPAPRPRTWSR